MARSGILRIAFGLFGRARSREMKMPGSAGHLSLVPGDAAHQAVAFSATSRYSSIWSKFM